MCSFILKGTYLHQTMFHTICLTTISAHMNPARALFPRGSRLGSGEYATVSWPTLFLPSRMSFAFLFTCWISIVYNKAQQLPPIHICSPQTELTALSSHHPCYIYFFIFVYHHSDHIRVVCIVPYYATTSLAYGMSCLKFSVSSLLYIA